MLSGISRQVFATLCSNLLSVSYGTSIGWASTSLPFLESNETVLTTGPLTKDDVSWIQSVFPVGGFLGTLLIGWASDIIGRKKSMCAVAIPQILAWVLIASAKSSSYILVSRFLSGLSGGALYVLIPLYTSEISDDSVRGRLGSFYVFSVAIGILLSYTCGTFLSYQLLPLIYTPISILFLIGAMFYPDSVHFFVKSNKNDEAEKSLNFFRGVECLASNDKVKSEFLSIQSLVSVQSEGAKRVTVNDFLTKPARKVLMIGVMLQFLEQFSGLFGLLFFVSTIFKYSGSSISPNASSIIVGVIQIIGCYCSTLLVDRAGRKILISTSAFGISLGMFVFALYSYLNSHGYELTSFNWIPLVSFSFTLWIANLGVLSLPFLVTSELIITLPNIKGHIYIFCLCLSWVFAFVILKYFETLIAMIGMSGLMLIFSINCLVGGIFVVVVVPETKERSFPEILAMLEK